MNFINLSMNIHIPDKQASGNGGKEKLPEKDMRKKPLEEPDAKENPFSFG